jgi:acetoin utilization deacetylase AcuC-like enzyme
VVAGLKEKQERCEGGGLSFYGQDTYVNEFSLAAANSAVGGLIAAVEQVIKGEAKNAFAIIRPPYLFTFPVAHLSFTLQQVTTQNRTLLWAFACTIM